MEAKIGDAPVVTAAEQEAAGPWARRPVGSVQSVIGNDRSEWS